jgi:hypothetical protein
MRTERPKAMLNVQRRTHASFGDNAVALAAHGADIACEGVLACGERAIPFRSLTEASVMRLQLPAPTSQRGAGWTSGSQGQQVPQN